jgi:hypothetical protein
LKSALEAHEFRTVQTVRMPLSKTAMIACITELMPRTVNAPRRMVSLAPCYTHIGWNARVRAWRRFVDLSNGLGANFILSALSEACRDPAYGTGSGHSFTSSRAGRRSGHILIPKGSATTCCLDEPAMVWKWGIWSFRGPKRISSWMLDVIVSYQWMNMDNYHFTSSWNLHPS